MFTYSGESESAAQQTVNRKMERVRGSTQVEQKSWQVLSVALAFSCIESFRDLFPLKRVILARDWVGAAKRASPSPSSRSDCTKHVQFCTVCVTRFLALMRILRKVVRWFTPLAYGNLLKRGVCPAFLFSLIFWADCSTFYSWTTCFVAGWLLSSQ